MTEPLDFGERDALLLHGPVQPQWLDGGRRFRYAAQRAGRVEHVLVDVAARTRQVVAAAPAPVFGAHEAAAPDGSWAVSLDGANLRRRNAGSDTIVALTGDGAPDDGYGDFTDFVSQLQLAPHPRAPSVLFAPDSSAFAVLRVDRRRVPLLHLVQSAPPDGRLPRLHSYRYPTPLDAERGRETLWLVRRDGSRVRTAIDGLECSAFTHLAMHWARWSADSRHLYLVDGSRDGRRLVLWRIDAADGAAGIVHEETGPGVVLPSPSIAEPAQFHPLRDGSVLWWSQRSGWGHIDHLVAGRPPRAVTAGDWQVRTLLHVDEDAGRIVFTAGGREPGRDPYPTAAYAVSIAGGEPLLLTPEPGQHDCTMAPDGGCLIDVVSTVREPPRSLLRDRNGAVLMELETADASLAWPPAQPLPEPFSVPAADGTSLWGVLYKPAGFDPARRCSVVEVVYGAPQTAVAPKGWAPNRHSTVAEQLAAAGFVALIVDGPGTPYRSRDFQLASHGRIERCGGLPEHVAAIRRLAETRPWMDVDRVGIVGGSGGGYATVRALATFPDFYKVGVALCGNHDQAAYVAMWGERYHGLYDEALYAAQDNVTVAGAIRGPLLLIHGEMDDNVHPAATLRLADALRRAGRRFEMLIVPNAGHMVILLPDIQRRVRDFFAEHL